MEKLREDDYKIIDGVQENAQFLIDGIPSNVIEDVLKREQKYYLDKLSMRRRNIRAGREPLEGVLVDSRVKSLFELGEIDYKEAIRLDYFATLKPRIQSAYLEVINGIFDEALNRYTMVNNHLTMQLAEFKSLSMLATSAINNARTLCLKQSDVQELGKKRVESILKARYQNYLCNYAEHMTTLSQLAYGNDFYKCISISDLNYMRKSSASEMAELAKMLDGYELIMSQSASLFYYGTINILRGCSLPRDLIKEAEDSQRKTDKLMREGICEQYKMEEKSKLVIIDDSHEVQERQ